MKTKAQKQKINEMKSFKHFKLFAIRPVKKAPAPKKQPKVEIKTEKKSKPKEINLDSMQHLIQKVDSNVQTFSEDQKVVRKKIKIELPNAPITEKLKKAINEKLASVVENGHDFVLKLEKEQNDFVQFEKNIFSIKDLEELNQPHRKKELWNLLLKQLKTL